MVLKAYKRLALQCSGKTVDGLVHLGPTFESFHAAQPAVDVGKC